MPREPTEETNLIPLTLCFVFLSAQDFFGQLDQRVLSVFLKACDELTDILPQGEQQGLQETVRRLHKHWKVRGQHALALLRITVSLQEVHS